MRYDFFNSPKAGRVVIYTSAINGTSYHSIHKCNGASDAEAKNSFHREHKAEVLELIKQQAANQKVIKNEINGNC